MRQKSQQGKEETEAEEPQIPQTPLQKIYAEDKGSVIKSPVELCPKTKKWVKVTDACLKCDVMSSCPDFDRILNDPELRRRIEWITKNQK